MRKTSVRRFIHAVIDVLPLLVIPIFALNILHKETEPISITIGGYEYQEKYATNEVNNQNDIVIGNIYKFEIEFNDGDTYFNDLNVINIIDYNLYRIAVKQNSNVPDYTRYNISTLENIDFIAFEYDNNSDILVADTNDDAEAFYLSLTNPNNSETLIIKFYFVFTEINDYTEININAISESDYIPMEYIYNEEIVYNNTDIGSQFIYALYKPVHDYFNFNNLFNMSAIYDWIQLNLFSGTAPLPVFIIWNIIVYEFFVDLIFLFYSVFMFIIDFAEKCLERPFRR